MATASHHLKLMRAQEHLASYRVLESWYRGTDPYEVIRTDDPGNGAIEIAVVAKSPIPERLTIVAGDAIQCLRSSLDHLVVELAETYSGGHLMARIERDMQFPIATSKRSFRDARQRGTLGPMDPRAQALIHFFQPYRESAAGPIAKTGLAMLQELSNLDKHRRLPLVSHAVGNTGVMGAVVVGGTMLVESPSLFTERAVIVRFPPGTSVTFAQLPLAEVNIVFGRGTSLEGEPVAEVLSWLFDYVANQIIGRLRAYL